jgi:hypothetical protein
MEDAVVGKYLERDAAGLAFLDQLGSGVPDNTKFLSGDSQWLAPGGAAVDADAVTEGISRLANENPFPKIPVVLGNIADYTGEISRRGLAANLPGSIIRGASGVGETFTSNIQINAADADGTAKYVATNVDVLGALAEHRFSGLGRYIQRRWANHYQITKAKWPSAFSTLTNRVIRCGLYQNPPTNEFDPVGSFMEIYFRQTDGPNFRFRRYDGISAIPIDVDTGIAAALDTLFTLECGFLEDKRVWFDINNSIFSVFATVLPALAALMDNIVFMFVYNEAATPGFTPGYSFYQHYARF